MPGAARLARRRAMGNRASLVPRSGKGYVGSFCVTLSVDLDCADIGSLLSIAADGRRLTQNERGKERTMAWGLSHLLLIVYF